MKKMEENMEEKALDTVETTAVIDAVNADFVSEPGVENTQVLEPVSADGASGKKKGHKGLIITLIILLLLVVAGFAAFHPASPLAPIVQGWLAPTPTDAPNTDDEGLLPDEYVVRDAEVAVKVIFSAEGVGIEGVGDELTALEALMDAGALSSAAEALTEGSLEHTGVSLTLTLTEFTYPRPDGLTDPAQLDAFATQLAQLRERVAALEAEPIAIDCLSCTGTLELLPATYEVSLDMFVIDAEGHVWRLADPLETLIIIGDMELKLTYKAVDLTSVNMLQLTLWADDARGAGLEAAAATLLSAAAEDEEDEPVTPGGNGGGSGVRPGGNGGNSGGSAGTTPPAGHTHVWGATEYHVTTPGHYETVNHPAEYRRWHEDHAICSTCQADITSAPSAHLESTGHSGWYSKAVYFEEKIADAWSEEIWVPERGFYFHRCKTCGESEKVNQ